VSGVDRAALIKAADEAINRPTGTYSLRAGERALDAVLPLVAQAIEADFRDNVNDVAISDEADRALSAICNGMYRAARLVRSLAEEGQQQ